MLSFVFQDSTLCLISSFIPLASYVLSKSCFSAHGFLPDSNTSQNNNPHVMLSGTSF